MIEQYVFLHVFNMTDPGAIMFLLEAWGAAAIGGGAVILARVVQVELARYRRRRAAR